MYYWESLEVLHELIGMDAHQAKGAHDRWIGPYRVVIAEVISEYGKKGLAIEFAP